MSNSSSHAKSSFDQHRGKANKLAATIDLTSTVQGVNFIREVLALNQLDNFLRRILHLLDVYPSCFRESVLVLDVANKSQ